MPILHLPDADLGYDVTGRGPPMLLISGTATHGDVWKLHQVPEFSRDHMVITYDPRGTGRSVVRSKDFSGLRQTADAVALLDHLGLEQAIVCGHSMGGRIAQLLALEQPRLVGRLILMSTGASFPTRGIPLPMCLAMVEKGYERYIREHSVHVGVSRSFGQAHPQAVETFMQVRHANPPSLEIYLRHVIGRQDIDTSQRLRDIKVPTLVMVGEDEGHPSASGVTHQTSSEQLATSIPGARFVVVPGHGHYYPFLDGETTNAIMREFLRSCVG